MIICSLGVFTLEISGFHVGRFFFPEKELKFTEDLTRNISNSWIRESEVRQVFTLESFRCFIFLRN